MYLQPRYQFSPLRKHRIWIISYTRAHRQRSCLCFGQRRLHLDLTAILDHCNLDEVNLDLIKDRRQRVSMSGVPPDVDEETPSDRDLLRINSADAFVELYKRKYTSPLLDF